jgi:hypothetical protein
VLQFLPIHQQSERNQQRVINECVKIQIKYKGHHLQTKGNVIEKKNDIN